MKLITTLHFKFLEVRDSHSRQYINYPALCSLQADKTIDKISTDIITLTLALDD